jgi:hypothetical protein
MTMHPYFDLLDDIGVFRPIGEYSLQQAVQLARDAIAHAKELHLGKLLIVTTSLSGFDSPSLVARHLMARELASAVAGTMTIAVVTHAEFIDPQKFGVTVAANFGLVMDAFDSEDDAIAWLRSLK